MTRSNKDFDNLKKKVRFSYGVRKLCLTNMKTGHSEISPSCVNIVTESILSEEVRVDIVPCLLQKNVKKIVKVIELAFKDIEKENIRKNIYKI